MARPKKEQPVLIGENSDVQLITGGIETKDENKKPARPKLTVDVEYLSRNRPPFVNSLPRDWDNIYDENLGRDKRVEVQYVMVQDGKVISPAQATINAQCVAFDVPVKIANKYFTQARKAYRIYDPAVKFVPEQDIIGFDLKGNSADEFKAENQVLKNQLRESEKSRAALIGSLGKKVNQDAVVSAISTEKAQLMPTKSVA